MAKIIHIIYAEYYRIARLNLLTNSYNHYNKSVLRKHQYCQKLKIWILINWKF